MLSSWRFFFPLINLSLCVFVSLHLLIRLFSAGWSSAWLGVALAVWGQIGYFLYQVYSGRPPLGWLDRLSLALVCLGCALTLSFDSFWAFFYAVCFGLGGLWLVQSRYFLLERAAVEPLEAKELLSLPLRSTDGHEFSLTELKGQPILLIFVMGGWSPLCLAQLREIVRHKQLLVACDAQCCVISAHELRREDFSGHDLPGLRLVIDDTQTVAYKLGLSCSNLEPLYPGRWFQAQDERTLTPGVAVISKNSKLLFSRFAGDARDRVLPCEWASFLVKGMRATRVRRAATAATDSSPAKAKAQTGDEVANGG